MSLPNETTAVHDLHMWLREKAQERFRIVYQNPEGQYVGSVHAKLGSTQWSFHTGSGWTEPLLLWKANGKTYSLTWYDKLYSKGGDCLEVAVERLVDQLKTLDWKDPRELDV